EEIYFENNPHGMNNILDSVNSKKGTILLSAHLGAWDLAGTLLKMDGLNEQFHMVHFEHTGLTFNKIKDKKNMELVKSVVSNQQGQPIFQMRSLLQNCQPL